MTKLSVSLSPHVKAKVSTQRIMLDVIIALLPACMASVYYFGWRCALIIAVSVCAAVGAEALWCFLMKKPNTAYDLSAAVTGLLVAMNLPSTAPWWLPLIGSAFAVIIAKQFFGGLGQNFINPAIAARAFLLASWPAQMTGYVAPFADAVSAATPLPAIYGEAAMAVPSVMDMFMGSMPGVLGEVSKAALLAGALYLVIRRVIAPRIPLIYIGTVFVMSALWAGGAPSAVTGLEAILSGGLVLGACFMATDYVTCPLTAWGQALFALGCGIITFVIRKFSAYPDGITYAILFMNVLTPLIDRFIKPRKYGKVAKTA